MTAFTSIGLYSPKQAERLIGVEAEKIRRWLMPERSSKGPLWEPEPHALGAEDTLSFKDSSNSLLPPCIVDYLTPI